MNRKATIGKHAAQPHARNHGTRFLTPPLLIKLILVEGVLSILQGSSSVPARDCGNAFDILKPSFEMGTKALRGKFPFISPGRAPGAWEARFGGKLGVRRFSAVPSRSRAGRPYAPAAFDWARKNAWLERNASLSGFSLPARSLYPIAPRRSPRR